MFYSSLGTKVATNAPLADSWTESLFSFDLKQESMRFNTKYIETIILPGVSD